MENEEEEITFALVWRSNLCGILFYIHILGKVLLWVKHLVFKDFASIDLQVLTKNGLEASEDRTMTGNMFPGVERGDPSQHIAPSRKGVHCSQGNVLLFFHVASMPQGWLWGEEVVLTERWKYYNI